MSKGWFKRNTVGFGFHPSRWQGWVVMLALVALIAATMRWVRPVLETSTRLPFAAITFAILVFWLSLLSLVIWLTYDRSDSKR